MKRWLPDEIVRFVYFEGDVAIITAILDDIEAGLKKASGCGARCARNLRYRYKGTHQVDQDARQHPRKGLLEFWRKSRCFNSTGSRGIQIVLIQHFSMGA